MVFYRLLSRIYCHGRFLRFEINFGVAVAMGAAAGAGGIGFELFMASGFYFDLREVGFITYMILLLRLF